MKTFVKIRDSILAFRGITALITYPKMLSQEEVAWLARSLSFDRSVSASTPITASGTIVIMLHKWTRIETLMLCICPLRLVSCLSMELCPPDQEWQASWDLVVV